MCDVDWNECKHLSITEREQQKLRREEPNSYYAHTCVKNESRVVHRATRRNHDGRLYPCPECKGVDFEHV